MKSNGRVDLAWSGIERRIFAGIGNLGRRKISWDIYHGEERPDGPGRRSGPRRYADDLCKICLDTRSQHWDFNSIIRHDFVLSVASSRSDPIRRREAIEHTRRKETQDGVHR